MLILSRRIGEKIVIGENVVITVAGIQNNKVRIGCEAPRECIIDREEIAEKKKSRTVRPWKESL